MSSPPSVKKARPLSPHLQVYKPQLTSGLSILHRLTGCGLALGLPAFVLWLVAIAQGPEAYARFSACAQSTLGRIFLISWSWAFFFHLCTGVRHLLWDSGHFLDIKQVYKTGYAAVIISSFLTVWLWLKIYGLVMMSL